MLKQNIFHRLNCHLTSNVNQIDTTQRTLTPPSLPLFNLHISRLSSFWLDSLYGSSSLKLCRSTVAHSFHLPRRKSLFKRFRMTRRAADQTNIRSTQHDFAQHNTYIYIYYMLTNRQTYIQCNFRSWGFLWVFLL